jgi:hypothetical protein
MVVVIVVFPSRNVFKFGYSCIASECDNGKIAYNVNFQDAKVHTRLFT